MHQSVFCNGKIAGYTNQFFERFFSVVGNFSDDGDMSEQCFSVMFVGFSRHDIKMVGNYH
jgi:hypothetical protein